MYNLLQNHGSRSILQTPDGLKELLADISREVLRSQPDILIHFISRYLWALLETREHVARAVRLHTILNESIVSGGDEVSGDTVHDLIVQKMGVPELSEHLQQRGVKRDHAIILARVVDTEMKDFDGDVVRQERRLMKLIFNCVSLDAPSVRAVCLVLREVFVEYQRNKDAENATRVFGADEPWNIAASKTLELYATLRPTEEKIIQACITIQAAYRGYRIRKQLKIEAEIQSELDKFRCKCHDI